jgi:exosortase/archaeosortase family protein
MRKENAQVLRIFLRYLFVLLVSIPNLALFYIVFTPLTVYPSYFILNLFHPVLLSGNTFTIDSFFINIAPACVAGSAYFLLFLLNFSLEMNIKKRIFSLLFSFLVLLIVNVIRIVIFSLLLVSSFAHFDITHKIVWFFLSAVFVFAVWLLTIKRFNIRGIPFFNDIRFISSLIKFRKKIR